jgi:hypothetical protein
LKLSQQKSDDRYEIFISQMAMALLSFM